MSYWETMMRYGFGERVLMTQDAAIKAWARRQLWEGMLWLANEMRYEAYELMRADDEGMLKERHSMNAFEDGYAAERAGLGFLDNPNIQDSVEFRHWVDGYVKSMQDRRKKPTDGDKVSDG